MYHSLGIEEDLWDYFLGSVGETSSIIVCYFMIDSFLGRVYTMAFAGLVMTLGMSGVLFFGTAGFADYSNVGRFGVNCAYNVLSLYTSEVYEIALRGMGTGMANSWLEIGALIMPFILIPLEGLNAFYPFYVLLVFSIVFFAINLILPSETANKDIL